MLNRIDIEREFHELLHSARSKKAEELLLTLYSELKTTKSKDLEFIVSLLAHLYSMPETEDIQKAEACFLEREELSPGAYVKSQTAMFYLYVAQDFNKTIAKVSEISNSEATADPGSYYSALTLQGQALLHLDRKSDVRSVLEKLLGLIEGGSSSLPYGDEVNFLQAAMKDGSLKNKCREILNLTVPKMRSREYVQRGKILLNASW
ncbi:MAG TPA: hypothetical protein VJN64_09830 [Terriglobales bacterium]|nr:hypothetical protein [Terriglobales bacterium]